MRHGFVLVCLGMTATMGCTGAGPDAPLVVPARSEELTRVIVQLRVVSTESEAQRLAAIVDARDALLRELGSTSYRVLRVYETIPFVALELTPDALRIVQKSMLVVGIEQDSLNAPQ